MIKDVIISQKQELNLRLKELYIEREIKESKLDNPLIKVIIGPRRAGKSFFALHALNKKDFGYVNFDDERLLDTKDYDEILEVMNTVYNHPKYILLDEIQNLPRWELFVNRLQRRGLNLTITGSNSHLLSKELATHLTGRHAVINIFPFSFREYLSIDQQEKTSYQIKEKLDAFLVSGGYPEPLIRKMSYIDYLSTLFNAIIYKDIVKRYKVRFPQGIEELAYYLMSNIASEYSYTNLAKMTKIKSAHTVQKYLDYLEEAFIFFSIVRFSNKVKEQISSNKKIYCIDNGFITAKAFKTSQNLGKIYENAVACELKKRELNTGQRVYFWKNPQQEEIDFVVKDGTKITQLIQVCCDVSSVKTKNREIRALLKGAEELKCRNLVIINPDKESEEEHKWFGKKVKVKFIPLWKWLMAKQNFQ